MLYHIISYYIMSCCIVPQCNTASYYTVPGRADALGRGRAAAAGRAAVAAPTPLAGALFVA